MDSPEAKGKEVSVAGEEANKADVDSIKYVDIHGAQYRSARGVASLLSSGENRRNFETALNKTEDYQRRRWADDRASVS